MTHARLRFTFLSYWHAGTGLRRGGEADHMTLREPDDGPPFLPGRTVKGLLREGVMLASSFPGSPFPPDTTGKIFGRENKTELISRLVVENAIVPDDELGRWLRQSEKGIRDALFDTIASTALTEDGQAKTATLRVTEVCLPLMLEARIEWDETILNPELHPHTPADILGTAARLIRSAGSHRHRGLGRCRVELITDTP